MAMTVTPVDPLDGEAVLSLEQAKAHVRVDGDDEDDLIGALRDAAVEWVEAHCAVALSPRAWLVTFDGFAGALRLPVGPVSAVGSVKYLDTAGAEITLASNAWRRLGAILYAAAGLCWPSVLAGGGAVSIEFTAGHDDDTRPQPLVAAVRLLLGHLYANREGVVTTSGVTEVPLGVTALCAPYRTPVFG